MSNKVLIAALIDRKEQKIQFLKFMKFFYYFADDPFKIQIFLSLFSTKLLRLF